MKNTIRNIFLNSFEEHAKRTAVGFLNEEQLTYTDLKARTNEVFKLFATQGLKKGDKIAIYSANSPNWVATYAAACVSGIIAVTILPDFHPNEVQNILNHSEADVLFVSANLYQKIKDEMDFPTQKIILIDDLSLYEEQVENPSQTIETQHYWDANIEEGDLATIIYTSGTTGSSKGVMLSQLNIAFTAKHAYKVFEVAKTDRFISLLPLSHAYENTIGCILPMMQGAWVTYLRKPPTASVLLPALQIIKPTVMLSVPLIIEKIYRGKVKPAFAKGVAKTLYNFAPMRKLLNRIAGKKLMKTFGGELRFFGIGGSKLDGTVEKFLREAKFPYAIGYGLTETAPMIAGCNPQQTRFQSTGPTMPGVVLKLNEPDPITGEGEIWSKAPNTMLGYYKEPELTKKVITEDGWFRTGDTGIFDKDGWLYIKGRIKTMILGASGENIYPEEIESVLNNMEYVQESLVLQQRGRLVAMIHLNMQEFEKRFDELKIKKEEFEHKAQEYMQELKVTANKTLNKFSQIQIVEFQPAPFERTPTKKIKRYLYA